jgi:hypothetical protein
MRHWKGGGSFTFIFCCAEDQTQGLVHANQTLYHWTICLIWGVFQMELTPLPLKCFVSFIII